MATNLNVGDGGLDGAADTNPPVSQATPKPIDGAPQVPQDFLSVQKTLESLTKEVRGLQSRQDKEKTETQRVLDEIKSRIDSGASFDEAKAATFQKLEAEKKDDLLIRIAKKVGVLDESSPQPAGNGPQVTDPTGKLIVDMQLDPNDAGVLKIVAETQDVIQRAARLGAYKASQGTRQPDPSAAPALQSQPAPSSNPEAEKAKLAAKLAVWQKNPSAHRAEIDAAVKELGW